MRTIIWTGTLLLTLGVSGGPLLAQHHPAGPSQEGAAATGSHNPAISTGFNDLQWQPIVPELGADSPQIAILRVDPKTQATQLLIRMPKQMHVPMHWHSANETHTVIRGTWVFEHDGQRHELGPGGFNYLPARVHHQAWSSDDALVFITVDSAWDITWMSAPPTVEDLGQPLPGR